MHEQLMETRQPEDRLAASPSRRDQAR
jgi:hypothetical protein